MIHLDSAEILTETDAFSGKTTPIALPLIRLQAKLLLDLPLDLLIIAPVNHAAQPAPVLGDLVPILVRSLIITELLFFEQMGTRNHLDLRQLIILCRAIIRMEPNLLFKLIQLTNFFVLLPLQREVFLKEFGDDDLGLSLSVARVIGLYVLS